MRILLAALFIFANASAEPVSLDRIISAAQNNDFDSVESALEWVNTKDPKYFESYTMMRKSRSLQDASPTEPRVILFGEDASTLITFNGSNASKGGSSIEIIQARTQPKAHWEFREIVFKDGSVQISEKNPSKCAVCHSTSFNPIWAEYDQWPGAFGERDDAIIDFSKKFPPPAENELVSEHRLMRKQLIKFMANRNGHPRYKFLKIREGNRSTVAPYADVGRTGTVLERPNLNLTKLLANHHGKVVADRIQNTNKACFDKTKYLLLANLLRCSSSKNNRTKISSLNQRLVDSERMRKFLLLDRYPRHGWSSFKTNSKMLPRTSLLRTLGVSREDWNLSLNPEKWSYFLGALKMKDKVVEHIYESIRKSDLKNLPPFLAFLAKSFPNYYRYEEEAESYDDIYNYDTESYEVPNHTLDACNLIVEKASEIDQSEIEDACYPESGETDIPVQVTQICQECHTEKKAPDIDFEAIPYDEAWKKIVLDRIDEKSDLSMPPKKHLSQHEKLKFVKWLTKTDR